MDDFNTKLNQILKEIDHDPEKDKLVDEQFGVLLEYFFKKYVEITQVYDIPNHGKILHRFMLNLFAKIVTSGEDQDSKLDAIGHYDSFCDHIENFKMRDASFLTCEVMKDS